MNARALLTEEQIREIRATYYMHGKRGGAVSRTVTMTDLASEYGCVKGTIEAILYDRTWQHIDAGCEIGEAALWRVS